MVDIRRMPAAIAIAFGVIFRPPKIRSLMGPIEAPARGPGFVYPDTRNSKAAQHKREKAKRKGVRLHRLHMKRRSS